MSSDENSEGMKTYANQEAVRTFILGLNSKYTSGTLYSHNPGNLEAAYATACTISHDNVNEEFETPFRLQNNSRQFQHNTNRNTYPQQHREERYYKPNVRMQGGNYQARSFNQYNQQQQRQQQQQPAPIPMDVDNSRQYMQTTRNNAVSRNNYIPNNIYKRDRASSSNNANNPQDRKFQRINQLNKEDLESVESSNYEEHYETGSTFLRRVNGLPCLQTKCGLTGTPVTLLIDTGSTNNYINIKCNIGKSINLKPKPCMATQL